MFPTSFQYVDTFCRFSQGFTDFNWLNWQVAELDAQRDRLYQRQGPGRLAARSHGKSTRRGETMGWWESMFHFCIIWWNSGNIIYYIIYIYNIYIYINIYIIYIIYILWYAKIMILIILENMYFSFWWEFREYDDGKTHIAWKSTHSRLMMGRWESCGAVVPDSWEILEYIYIYIYIYTRVTVIENASSDYRL